MSDEMDEIIKLNIEISKRDQSRLEERIKSFKEGNSDYGGGLIYAYKSIAVGTYFEHKNPEYFRKNLIESVNYQIKLFEIVEKAGGLSKDRDNSFVDITCYDEVFSALASGDWDITKTLVEHINIVHPVFKKSLNLPTYFQKMFRIFILKTPPEEDVFRSMAEFFERKLKSFKGYSYCFEAIYKKDEVAFKEAFDLVMKGHKVLCRPGSFFGCTVNVIIAIWPLGLLNLSRFNGMNVEIDHPLIPKDLIIPPHKN